MRGFLIGIVVGLLAGGAGVFLALEKPWRSGDKATASADAGVAVAKKTKPRKGRRGRWRKKTRYRMNDKPIILTAAQRAMSWRGSAKRPAENMDMGNASSGRSLTDSEINRVIGSQSGAVIGCIQKARGSADLSATITMKMLVNGQGRVTKVAMRAPRYLFDRGFAGCARAAARSMRFAAAGKHTVVTAPYNVN